MRFVLIVLFLFCSVVGYAQTRPEISIASNASTTVVAGLPILLSDLGTSGFVSSAVFEKANSVEILGPMAEGEERTYSNAELVKILKEKVATQADLVDLKWTYFVPEKVKIVAKKNALPTNRLQSEILAQLMRKCENCQFQLKDMKYPNLKGQSIQAFDLETSSLRVSGSFVLPLRIGGASIFYVSGRAVASMKALVTTRAYRMGEKIEAKDLKTEQAELPLGNDSFASVEDLNHQLTARPLVIGHAVSKSDLRKETVVTRGQMIRAISGDEQFEVSGQMLAEENGSVGDTIKVKNTETQKSISGRVIERGVVRVQ